MFFARISFKIAILYSIAQILSALGLFVLTSYLLLSSLREKDRDLLNEKAIEYGTLYTREGLDGLRRRVTSRAVKESRDFVVRLSDAKGQTLFIHSPDRSDDEDAPQLADIDRFLSQSSGGEPWIKIPGGGFGDDVEVVSKSLPDHSVLQVGKDTEDREDFFYSFVWSYVRGLLPISLLALAVGAWLSHRFLRPIRWLTHTVERIRAGQADARVALPSARDDLHRLATLFNDMVDHNAKLVNGMRDTVDDVAHDLRTPIMRLRNSVEKALSGEPDLERFQESLVSVQENSEIILTLVEAILLIREIETKTYVVNAEVVRSGILIGAAMDLYGFVAEERRIELIAVPSDGFDIFGDRARLLQALANLVDNAVKYSPAGTRVTISSEQGDEFAELSVSDEGPGIPIENLSKIWDRLYRGDRSRSTRGLGLGLSLVRAIAEAHGGCAVASRNSSGIGMTFTIRLPNSSNVASKT